MTTQNPMSASSNSRIDEEEISLTVYRKKNKKEGDI